MFCAFFLLSSKFIGPLAIKHTAFKSKKTKHPPFFEPHQHCSKALGAPHRAMLVAQAKCGHNCGHWSATLGAILRVQKLAFCPNWPIWGHFQPKSLAGPCPWLFQSNVELWWCSLCAPPTMCQLGWALGWPTIRPEGWFTVFTVKAR